MVDRDAAAFVCPMAVEFFDKIISPVGARARARVLVHNKHEQ